MEPIIHLIIRPTTFVLASANRRSAYQVRLKPAYYSSGIIYDSGPPRPGTRTVSGTPPRHVSPSRLKVLRKIV
jgi:hypothetical protein